MAPGSKVLTRYLEAAGLMGDLEAIGFHVVGYGCTTCIAEGTAILRSSGTACRIEDLPLTGAARVFSPTPSGELVLAEQSERMVQGARECVSLVLQDGRELECTPDHEILCADGRWVRADRLALGRDRVAVGLEAPLDQASPAEAGWMLRAGEFEFTFASPAERQRTLAFGRLLGHLLCDGSISLSGQGRLNVGQAIDREVALDDVERITGKRPLGTAYDERKWSIVLPKALTLAIQTLPGVRSGRRMDSPPALPAFVLDGRCPVSLVREFLGGLFGADGWAPNLRRYGGSPEDCGFVPPAFSQTARPEHVAELRSLMEDLLRLLERCGVERGSARVYEYPTRRADSSYPASADGVPRTEVRLQLSNGLAFVERVGFRYCVDKALKASAAAVYWRTIERIQKQRLWMAAHLDEAHLESPSRSFRQARQAAAAELTEVETPVFAHYSLLEGHDRFCRLPRRPDQRFKPLHRDSCGFPSPGEFLAQIGARDWFGALAPRGANQTKHYAVDKHSFTLPTLSLQVIDRRYAGIRPVFDLSVPGPRSFIAGPVAVHNCIGNSGPLPEPLTQAITRADLVAAAVPSGNRN